MKKLPPLLVGALAATSLSLHAQTQVWTLQANNGVWSGTQNWNEPGPPYDNNATATGVGPIANGAGVTADFSRLALTNNRNVTVDGNYTLGSWLVGNQSGNYGWRFLATTAQTLNFDNNGAGAQINVANISAGVTIGRATSIVGSTGAGSIGFALADNLAITSAASGTLGIAAAVTGSGNVTFLANGSGAILFETGPSTDGIFSHAGGITNLGLGSGKVILSASIGSSVTGVTQASASSTLELRGTNTYAGPTEVSTGTLLVNNTSGSGTGSGTVTVQGGGKLGGTGRLGGNTVIFGTHAPGNSVGIQSFGSNLAYADGAVVDIEISSNSTTQGSPAALFDQVLVEGDLSFSGATTMNLAFNIGGSAVDWSNAFWTSDQSWLIYDVTGSTSGFPNFSLSVLDWQDAQGDAFQSALPGGKFSLAQIGDDIFLNYTIVPEPSVGILLLGAVSALSLIRRGLLA